MRAMLRTLKRNGMVGILIDQNVDTYEGVFVDYFGRPACTTDGLALLALHTGAPVLPSLHGQTPRRAVPSGHRPRGGGNRHGQPGGGYPGEHPAFHEDHRRDGPAISGSVALGSPALEDPALPGTPQRRRNESFAGQRRKKAPRRGDRTGADPGDELDRGRRHDASRRRRRPEDMAPGADLRPRQTLGRRGLPAFSGRGRGHRL